jgi:hypothetical protein
MNAEPQTAVDVSRLFAPQVLLPTQRARSAINNRWLLRLYGAILEDALACLEGRGAPNSGGLCADRERARRRQQAWEWIMSEAETCFSFITICSVLELNSEAVRAALRRWGAPGRNAA